MMNGKVRRSGRILSNSAKYTNDFETSEIALEKDCESLYLYKIGEKVRCLKNRILEEAQIIERRLRAEDHEPQYLVHYHGKNKRLDTWVTKYALRGNYMSSPYDDPNNIHFSMLSDNPRSQAYCDAIIRNKHLFHGKTVADIGGGMGILALKCAEAGAVKVYMIEPASVIRYARQTIKDNGFEGVIKCYHADVANARLPEKVDIIVAEWMGYALFYENGLQHLIEAREKFLKPDGLMFPDYSRLYICGIQDCASRASFWDDVEGYNMSCCSELSTKSPLIATGVGTQVTNSVCLKEINLSTCTYEDSFIDEKFVLSFMKHLKSPIAKCNAFAIWFDSEFQACNPPVRLCTGRDSQDTHWMQVYLYLERPDITPRLGSGISGHFWMRPNKYNPNVDMIVRISVTYDDLSKDEGRKTKKSREFMLSF
eukprot:118541_1